MIRGLASAKTILTFTDYDRITDIGLEFDYQRFVIHKNYDRRDSDFADAYKGRDSNYNSDDMYEAAIGKLYLFKNLKSLHLTDIIFSNYVSECISVLDIEELIMRSCRFCVGVSLPVNVRRLNVDYARTNFTCRNWNSLSKLVIVHIRCSSKIVKFDPMRSGEFLGIVYLVSLRKLSFESVPVSNDFAIDICNNLIGLEELSLLNTMLRFIPKEISKLVKLQKLYVIDDCFEGLPDEIGGLMNLTSLHIGNGFFSNFDNVYFKLPVSIMNLNLTYFFISPNIKIKIPNEFAAMRCIEKFICGDFGVLRWENNVIVSMYDEDTRIADGLTRICICGINRSHLDDLPLSLEELVIYNPNCPLMNLPPGLKKLVLLPLKDDYWFEPIPDIKLPYGCELVVRNTDFDE
ncbi:MAG: hypothetical protein Gaeavirus7_16 [Gaeavirus sp.]|uniref:Uncharacterized protein n=1 Tax=Gaeavirus sp. TaxID=2487767 RepID=A0A3G5A3M4_9VIRU|nr:MAG: hypothetical protein Gaeavirus7_16 [Gaeavirus sp.]